MKISAEELSELCSRQRIAGITEGRAQKETEWRASTKAVVLQEQERIVEAIRAFFSTADTNGPAWPPAEIDELLRTLSLRNIK